jgi:hypothetical protein
MNRNFTGGGDKTKAICSEIHRTKNNKMDENLGKNKIK